MQLQLKKLSEHLKHSLLPLYLISGDESLLAQEARDAIVLAAKSRGFSEKTVCHVDASFQTDTLSSLIDNHSLFCEKKLIDIRNPAAKFDAKFTALIQDYTSHPNDNYLLIISTDKLTSAQQKSAWYENCREHGGILSVWPLKPNEFPAWIMERAKSYQLTLSTDIANLITAFSEGNLLNAQQTLQKLGILFANQTINREQAMSVLSDHARFSIFDLAESLSQNNPKKIMRIITRLSQTGEEPPLVLWAICRKLRENSSRPNTKKALQLAATVDEVIKGAKPGDVWQGLLQLCLTACGAT
jgi:DNA polymerase-3 subunit delta